jgi:hypothetical protein
VLFSKLTALNNAKKAAIPAHMNGIHAVHCINRSVFGGVNVDLISTTRSSIFMTFGPRRQLFNDSDLFNPGFSLEWVSSASTLWLTSTIGKT